MKQKTIRHTLLFVIILLFYSFAVKAEDAKQTIRMMYFDVPPFIIFNETTGQISGATYDFIENYISKEMQVKFIWDKKATVITRQLIILKNESNCASALIVYSPERAGNANFSKTPYIGTKPALALLKTNRLQKIEHVEDILNLKIGYAQGLYLSPFMRDKRIQYDFISNPNFTNINLQKMLSNRINAVYAPNTIQLFYEIQQMKIESRIKIVELPENQIGMYLAFSKNSEKTINTYNDVFKKIGGTAIYKNILVKYIVPK